ncbi:uncharacterized protein LAJ45_11737 [Morchella importuna]|uniref:uncharacterized protein n=1 Tax=Morchella importuna TaxID=1174673 RepID=UPI001E8E6C2E|nr:uncharacterized protein LAJ45_11737 [Morchella importuna]KAH8144289.1 hypothetical protein LAJ45_11737 [Morchella importuna]
MNKLTPERQLIHAGPSCVATKAAGVKKALTKGGRLRNWKHSLTLREKRGSDGIASFSARRQHRNLTAPVTDTESFPEASGGASPGPEGLTGSRPRASSLEVGRSALQEEQQSKISKPPTPSRPPFEYTDNPEESDTESDTTILDEPDTPQSAKARSKAPATPQKAQKASADSPSDAESDTTIHDEPDEPQSAKARSKAPATPEKAQKASADSPSMPPRRGRASAAYKITSIEQMREILQLTGRDDVYRALRTALSDEMTRIG